MKVRGDWLPTEHPGYEAVRVDEQRWNGFAVPYFKRSVVEQISHDTEELAAKLAREYGPDGSYGCDLVVLEDDGRVRVDSLDSGAVVYSEQVEPAEDGTYPVGGWAWCWYEAKQVAS